MPAPNLARNSHQTSFSLITILFLSLELSVRIQSVPTVRICFHFYSISYFATQDNDNAQVGMSMMENPNLMDAANFGGPQSPIGEYLPPGDYDDGDGDYKIK